MRAADRALWAPFRSLVAGQGISLVLGLVFWVAAARLVTDHDVGVAAAAISAQTLLGLLASLGVGTHLVAELPRTSGAGRRRTLLVRGLLGVAGAGALLGVVVAVAARLAGGALGTALGDPARASVLVVGAAVAAVVLVLDEAVLGLRRSGVQTVRNVTASSVRLPLALALLLLVDRDALVLQVAWVVPLVVSVAVAWSALRLPADDRPVVPLRDDLATHVRPALRHHLLNLAVAAATQLVPVAAGLTLVATDNAAFAIAWLLVTAAYLPPYLVTVSLFSHAANAGPDAFRSAMGSTVMVSLGASLVTIALTWTFGGTVLQVFGGGYADESELLLSLLVPAGLWMVVKDHLVAWWRAERRFALASGLAAASVGVEILGALTGALVGGATGLAIGWVSVTAVELLVAGPVLWRIVHPRTHDPRASRPAPEAAPAPVEKAPDDAPPPRLVHPAFAAVACVMVLAALTWLVVPSLDQLRRGAPGDVAAQRSSSGLDESDTTPGTPGTTPGTMPVATPASVPALDLSVKTDTGVPRWPHLAVGKVRQLVASAADAGASTVSTTVSWRAVRPVAGRSYDFRGLDRVLAAARVEGLDVRVQLVHTPDWAIAGPPASPWRPPTSPTELRLWSRFVADVLRHLDGRARYLEVWTEPNRPATWTTGPDPVAFARMMEVSAGAVQRIDPSVRLITGGLAGNDLGYARGFMAAVGGERPFDLVGVHPWSEAAPTAPPVDVPGTWGPVVDSFSGFQAVHQVVGAPLYLGEVGYPVGPLAATRRAAYATQALDLAANRPYVVAISWYHLHPTPWDPRRWSLLDERGRPDPTYDALRAWTYDHRRSATRSAS